MTGLGIITPIGIGVDGLRAGLRRGRSAVGPITDFDPSPFVTHIAAAVRGFDPAPYLDGKKLKRLDKFSQFAVAASKMAVADGRLDLRREDRDRIGVCLGTALGGVGFAEEQYPAFLTQGPRGVNPMLALSVFNGAGSCNIAIELGVTGPATANGDSCASVADRHWPRRGFDPGRQRGRDAGRRLGSAAVSALLRRVRPDPRHEPAQRRPADGVAPV